MLNRLALFQEGAQQAAEEAAAHGAGEEFNFGEMIMHHLVDSSEMEVPWGVIHLPEWEPIHIGSLAIDLSPSKHVVFLVLAAIIVFLLFTLVSRVVRSRIEEGKAPTGFANAIEAMVFFVRDEMVRPSIGHGADRFTPYILTLFFFILTMNLLGLVPWGGTATGNISVTAALAVLSFLVVEISGLLALGPGGYMKTVFFFPKGIGFAMGLLVMLIMAPVELLGKFVKPFALAIRLFANMTAGHTVVLALLGLIFLFGNLGIVFSSGIALGAVLAGTAIMALELFVAFLQAYVFALLTAVFIGMIRHAH